MFTLLFRKMRNTKWMVLCLLIGFVMASAMMSTIPIYMNASLQRMLVKDLESFQTEYEIYPGAYNTSYGLKMDISGSEQQKAVENYNNKVEAKFKELGLPEKLDKKKRAFQMGFLIFIPFLVIDLVVSSTLMAMGMMMLPPTTISTPFKILLFVMADGWNLIIGNLMSTFN